MKATRTSIEEAVHRDFASGGYQAWSICANPNCDHHDRLQWCAGQTPGSRICIECFEYGFGCKHPRRIGARA